MGMVVYTPDSTKILHLAYADFVSRQIGRPVHVVQYDDELPILAVKLFRDGQAYAVPENADVNIKLCKPDGKFVYNSALGCNAGRDTVYFEITYQMVVLSGEISPVVEVINGSSVAGSSPIGIVIDRNPVQKEEMESTSEWKMIQEAVEYTKEAVSAAAGASASASNAASSATMASSHAFNASASAGNAKTSETNASVSAASASGSASAASASATSAETSAGNAKTSETNASVSAASASGSASAASASASSASASAGNAKTSETNAASSETEAALSETNASRSADLARSWAVGTGGEVRDNDDEDCSKGYAVIAMHQTNEAQELLEQAQRVIAALSSGALIPIGTVAFEDLPMSSEVGYMYNISNDFVTDERFAEGEGLSYTAGMNVYWTAEGKWDVLAGVPVTAESIGLGNVNNTADKDKRVAQSVRLGMPRTSENPSDLSDLTKYPNGSLTVKEFAPVADVIPDLPSGNYYHIYTGQGADPAYATQLALGMTASDLAYRRKHAGVWGAWNSLIFSGNIGQQSVKRAAIASGIQSLQTDGMTEYPEGSYLIRAMFNGTGFKLVCKNNNADAAAYGVIVDKADKAVLDGSGNVIANTYAKKSIYGDDFISMGRKYGTNVGRRSFVFSDDSSANGNYSVVLGGSSNEANGNYSVVLGGYYNEASVGESAVLGGYNNMASGDSSAVLGGYYNTASGDSSVVLGGSSNEANGLRSVVLGGSNNEANGNYSAVLGGYDNMASNFASAACGKYSKIMTGGGALNTQVGDVFVIGNGTSVSARSNALRVTHKGDVLGTKAFQSSGADYAEFIKPWADGNPEGEDRVGYFVTIKDGFLEKAGEGDYIVGITSGNPSVVGNADEDYYWRYERDEFNRIVMEDVPEVVQQTDGNGDPMFDEETHEPVMVETGKMIQNARMKLAEGYDPSMQDSYVPRAERPEWDYVGMVGVVPVRDDGTCMPRCFCQCGGGGVATFVPERGPDCFFVLERISDCVVSVILK